MREQFREAEEVVECPLRTGAGGSLLRGVLSLNCDRGVGAV